jgi:hypothetical protein
MTFAEIRNDLLSVLSRLPENLQYIRKDVMDIFKVMKEPRMVRDATADQENVALRKNIVKIEKKVEKLKEVNNLQLKECGKLKTQLIIAADVGELNGEFISAQAVWNEGHKDMSWRLLRAATKCFIECVHRSGLHAPEIESIICQVIQKHGWLDKNGLAIELLSLLDEKGILCPENAELVRKTIAQSSSKTSKQS